MLLRLLYSVGLLVAPLWAATPPGPTPATALGTPLKMEDLDTNVFNVWVDGTEQPILLKTGPRHVIWTQNSQPEWNGVTFGESKISGARHLRIGWQKSVGVGTVLARAGGQLSVLKADRPFPGRLAEEGDWIPAQRIRDGKVTTEALAKEEYATWVLPPGTQTRALRFTHTSAPIDRSYAGWLGGVYVLSNRLVNLAPQAVASASGNHDKAFRLNNESNDGTWTTWDNQPDTNALAISATSPAWILLTWPQAVRLRGLGALWAGFAEAEVQTYDGPEDRHPRDANDTDWLPVRTFARVENQYPRALGINWMDFGREISTRAVRLRITRTINEAQAHGHLKGNTKEGRRIWLGELLALQALGPADLPTAILPPSSTAPVHPPIPLRFHLPANGLVTLVVEDAHGRRVRNLIAETPFPAGDNVAWWDGMDDLLRDPEAPRHGVYRLPEHFVAPGTYRVRGLWRQPVELRYEFSLYNAGQPAWEIADTTGAWLANHTPPCSALFVPGKRAPGGQPLVFLGSYISEGGHGLAWVNLEGRKQGGVGWVGGNWTGAPYLARDDGPLADTNVFAYAAAAWGEDTAKKTGVKTGEIRITALTTNGHKPVLKHSFDPGQPANAKRIEWSDHIGGLAVCDHLLVVSLPQTNQLLFVDTLTRQALGTAELANPRGLAFGPEGRTALYALSGRQLVRLNVSRLDVNLSPIRLPQPQVVVAAGPLQAPKQLTVDAAGQIFISDHGQSHQVKVFSPAGRLVRTIGRPGAPQAGPYDPLHLNHPDGMAIDERGRLWVTENDFQPKRVSVWTPDGHLDQAFYGPSEYGGGGKLDPLDKTRFYYHGMEFQLDWNTGRDRLVRVFYRPQAGDAVQPDGHSSSGLPEQPHRVQGRSYFANDHNSNPTGGPGVAMLWRDVDGLARPVAALGRAQEWELLKDDAFKSLWPPGVNPRGEYWKNSALFVWSDLNGDARVQAGEVQLQKGTVGSITVAPDLSFLASRFGTNAVRFAPRSFTRNGAPVYDLNQGEILARGAQGPSSSGGDQVLWHPEGWTILTTPPAPYAPSAVGGVFKGEPRWSYPSLWPGLHASHDSPPPGFPGMVIGTTRLLGDFITPPKGEAGPLWCVNGNQGNMYLFTIDGLFVAELFKDVRRGPTWSMPSAPRGMLLNDLTLHDENFWPSITQTRDGAIYLVDGARSSLVRVDGLDTIRRLPESQVTLGAEELTRARAFFQERESARQQAQGSGTLRVRLRTTPPQMDGRLEDWPATDWVDIDKSGVAAYFDSKSKPYDVRGALAVSGDRLYAAYRTGDASLLRNTGETPTALFKTGGALDLMVGADASADPKRAQPVAGDARLLVTLVKGQMMARLYRAVVPGTTEPVPFSSPWRTLTLDRVDDVTAQVEFAGTNGNYEISLPLAAVGLRPQAGRTIKADLGILRGNGFQTVQRVYWANKASGITADVPSEAELTPRLWGRCEFIRGE
jgi:hypothetical protein